MLRLRGDRGRGRWKVGSFEVGCGKGSDVVPDGR